MLEKSMWVSYRIKVNFVVCIPLAVELQNVYDKIDQVHQWFIQVNFFVRCISQTSE